MVKDFEGLLIKILKADGGPTQLQEQLISKALKTRVLEQKPGERTAIVVEPLATAI